MKEFRKVCSILVFFAVGMWAIGSTSAYAEGSLDHSGEMRLKTDRIGQDTAEREKQDTQSQKETELEKQAPGLFKEQTRAVIQEKQKELNHTVKSLEQNLFVQPRDSNETIEISKQTLFSNDYKVQNSPSIHQVGQGNSSSKIATGLVGFVLACCGGVYIMMRKMLE
ncbi:type VII secretion protein EssA [Robertmurraya korlensis]|uniref:type VII secretion protein EssA n=1 Tax=Robertmurraya korlensis TaxID=519977 RepID=UPI00204146A1|nr:type VII secretion protein EssA [Robertmurraya korlensis]MCM3603323.1 type VII secretion protein EssA [Robertmurraya korlensis]